MTGLEYLLQKQSKFILIFALFSSSFIYSEAIVNVEDLRRDGIGFRGAESKEDKAGHFS